MKDLNLYVGQVSNRTLLFRFDGSKTFVEVQDGLLKNRFQKLCSLKKSEETMIYLVLTPKSNHQHSVVKGISRVYRKLAGGYVVY